MGVAATTDEPDAQEDTEGEQGAHLRFDTDARSGMNKRLAGLMD